MRKKQPDNQITLKEAEQILKQAVNMALNKDGESSYTLSFEVKATEEECYFIFYVPSALVLNAVSCVVFIVSLFVLIKNRGFSNYIDSILDTIKTQNSAKKFTQHSEVNQQSVQDKIVNNYNYAIRYSYVDYRKDDAICKIRIPSNADAADLVKAKLKAISDEIHDLHFEGPESFSREHGYYVLKGRKKDK